MLCQTAEKGPGNIKDRCQFLGYARLFVMHVQ